MPLLMPVQQETRWLTASRWLAAGVFVVAGANHFRNPEFYREIVPSIFPAPRVLVAVSGVFEIIGGVGFLVRRLRGAAGWGLLALLVAVFPANVYMAVAPDRVPRGQIPVWALWLRLPLQAVLMLWVWWVSRSKPESRNPKSE